MPEKFGGAPSEIIEAKPTKLNRTEIEATLERGDKNFDGKNLADLDLAELNFEGASFRGADVRGLILCRAEDEQKKRTNIRGTDWTDATFADLGPQTVFQHVNAEGAMFGFSESLEARRKRQKDSGKNPDAKDSGGFQNFDGRGGNFRQSRWVNVDFGGDVDARGRPVAGYEALFTAADLSGARLDGVELRGIDWSDDVVINDIVIKDPESLRGLTLRDNQVRALADGIELSNVNEREEFKSLRKQLGDAQALREYFGVIIK